HRRRRRPLVGRRLRGTPARFVRHARPHHAGRRRGAKGAAMRLKTTGGLAFAGLISFLAVLYSNPGNWFDELAEVGFAKIAAALAVVSVIPAVGAISSYYRGEHLVDGDRAGWIGIFGNPNDLAYHLVVGIAMALAAGTAARRKFERLFYFSLLVPLGFALELTK